MAPLTWRNVDAPSFSGPNEMWRLAANLMNQGFDRARQGIDDFRTITTEEQSAAMMQKVIGAGNDPAAIQAAVAGANPAYVSPQALQFANNQPGVMIERQGQMLQNDIRGQSIRANDYNFGRTQLENQRADENYALVPEATAAMTNLRTQMASGALTGDAAAAAQQEFLTKYGRALGITDAAQVGSFFNNNQTAQTTQQGVDIQRMQNFEQLDGLIRNKDARGIAANVLTQFPNLATAQRALQGFGNIDPETKVAALKALEELAPAARPKTAAQQALESSTTFRGATLPGQELPANYTPVIMQNNGTRNRPLNDNLNGVLNSVLPNLGLTAIVTSGGQVTAEEAAQGLGDRTGSTRHDHGGAADVKFRTTDGRILSWENAQDVPILQNAVSELKKAGLTGFGAGSDYMGATTTHIGYGTPAVWGAKGGAPYQALLDAYNNTQTVISDNRGPTVDRAAATAAAPQYQAAMDAVSNNQPYTAPIDPTRVQIQNPDGTVSTEKTFTTKIGDAWFNIPSIVNGKELPEQEALEQFRAGTNPAVGVYQTLTEAERAAESRTADIGQMLDQAVNQTVATQEQAQAQTNAQITADASPSLAQTTATPTNDRTKEIVVNDRWTIPAVDPTASQASQDWQASQRRSAVSGVLESIKVDLATNQGGGPLANWAGDTWDYFMADPQTAQDNAAARDGAETALSWYQSDTAKKYFQDNPQALTEAAADPIGFQQRFKTPTQEAQTTQATPTSTTTAQQPSQAEYTRRALTAAESVDQAFSTALNTGAMNQTNAQYQSIVSAVQDRDHASESAAQTAARLTGENGPLKAYEHRYVTTAIQRIKDELGVNSAIAGAILQETGNYSDGFLGFGKGYDLDMDKARSLWQSYQQGDGLASANRGVATLNQSDMTQQQQQALTTMQEGFKAREAAIKAAIADPTTTAAERMMLQQELQNLLTYAKAQITQVLSSGALDNNLRANSSQ